MILIFGGTTEGRLAVKTLEEGEGPYFYSTRGCGQEIECSHGKHICGAMTTEEMIEFCRSHDIKLIIDAAHPFASRLHDSIYHTGRILELPVIRFDRLYPPAEYDKIEMCDSFENASEAMKRKGVRRLLALTGVQTIDKLKLYWEFNETFFRILNRRDSLNKAIQAGFPEDHLVYYEKDNIDYLIDNLHPDAILTKESGASGGYFEKIEAAKRAGIDIFVIRRPKLPENFIVVDGCHGLRFEIERIIPDFYSLHIGFTTGSCATAAAKAALLALLTGEKIERVKFKIPDGETLNMGIDSIAVTSGSATATVIKDAGDDPDVTHNSRISATVAFAAHEGIRFHRGEGIGVVTLPGLGLPVGEAAINPVPRKMIISELTTLYKGGLDITISLENGAALASKTFNPRVGVEGGVSIIGTSGIVQPFSHEAFLESIRREMNVAVANGCSPVVVNSGGKSERYIKALFPSLPQQAFIHYGNAIGETLLIARELRVPYLVIGIMLGKGVKLAEGHMDTHSHKVTINKEFIKSLLIESGCSWEAVKVIDNLTLARELPSLLSSDDCELLFPKLLNLCRDRCTEIFLGKLDMTLIADSGEILTKTWI